MKLTAEQIKETDHIPTETIKTDIEYTQKEITQYENEISALKGDRQGNRVEIYMTEGRILQRKEFIRDLKAILDYRENNNK